MRNVHLGPAVKELCSRNGFIKQLISTVYVQQRRAARRQPAITLAETSNESSEPRHERR